MSASLLNFIHFGQLGDLRLGMTQAEIVNRLGIPRNWSGKPPEWGPVVMTPEEASVWFYYNDAVGIQFDEHKVSISISVNPGEIRRNQSPFWDWPFDAELRMTTLREWLIENEIPFLDGSLKEEYYILIAERCLVTCFPYEKGQLVAMRNRKIMLIETVTKAECLPDFVRSSLTKK